MTIGSRDRSDGNVSKNVSRVKKLLTYIQTRTIQIDISIQDNSTYMKTLRKMPQIRLILI